MPDSIRILIADDHDVVRKGLALVLQQEPGFQVIGEASNGPQAIQRARELCPDILLLDYKMPGMTGAEAAQRARHNCPRIRCMILSGAEPEDNVLEAVEAVDGYGPKDVSPDELTHAIRVVASGKRYIHTSVLQTLLERTGVRTEPSPRAPTALSPRELEVLRLMATAMTYFEIGERLFISEETVRTHAKSILAKLGQPNRTQAVVAAVRLRLITLD
jgi:DNA-binding NarL/FixJ family response regulator